MKNICRLALFSATFIFLLTMASVLINPTKWFDDMRIQDRNARITQMMEQDPDTIDILNLGDSLSLSGMTPMELWRQRGFTAFNIGADGILMPEAYYALIEACDEQKPEYLLLETLQLFRLPKNEDMQILVSQPLYHRFAFLKYHSLWKTFLEGRGNRIYHKGYLINRIVRRYKPDPDYMNQKLPDRDKTVIPDFNRKWLEKIIKYCESKDIKIVLYSLPSPSNYNGERVSSIERLAEEYDLPYIDINEKRSELGINLKKDFSDRGDHLNLNGAVKVTGFFGEYLAQSGRLTDHRKDAAYKSWDEELIEYDQLVEEMEGTSFGRLKEKPDGEKKEKRRKKGKDHDHS